MTVKELKNQLDKYPDNAQVYIPKRGYSTWINSYLNFSFHNGLLYFIT